MRPHVLPCVLGAASCVLRAACRVLRMLPRSGISSLVGMRYLHARPHLLTTTSSRYGYPSRLRSGAWASCVTSS